MHYFITALMILVMVLRGTLLAYLMLVSIIDERWKKAGVFLILGFSTNVLNVVLAREFSVLTTGMAWSLDLIPTAIFQGSVILAMYIMRAKLFPLWYVLFIPFVAVVTAILQFAVEGDWGMFLRAVLHFNSLIAMFLASVSVAHRGFGRLGVAVVVLLGLGLLWLGISWDLIANNIRGI